MSMEGGQRIKGEGKDVGVLLLLTKGKEEEEEEGDTSTYPPLLVLHTKHAEATTSPS